MSIDYIPNNLLKLFGLALLFGILANILPDLFDVYFLGELFEVFAIGFIGAIGWELYKTKPWRGKNDEGGIIAKK